MTTKEELMELLRLCNADPSAIDVAELAYELGYKAGLSQQTPESDNATHEGTDE
jgi:hypothetical protein